MATYMYIELDPDAGGRPRTSCASGRSMTGYGSDAGEDPEFSFSPPKKFLRRRRGTSSGEDDYQRDPVDLALQVEEKQSAAECKREARLQAQRKRSSAAVARAKHVAATQQEKNLQDSERLRRDLDTRMEQARARREHNLVARTRKVSDHLEHAKHVAAHRRPSRTGQKAHTSRVSHGARVLQRWWRAKVWVEQRDAARRFLSHGIGKETFSALTFEGIMGLMSNKDTVRDTVGALKAVEHILSSSPRNAGSERNATLLSRLGIPAKQRGNPFPHRLYLSSLMMIAHPADIFTHGGKQPAEQSLADAAELMLDKFHAVCHGMAAPTRPEGLWSHVRAFDTTWRHYLECFLEWKEPDSDCLVEEIVRSFVEMSKMRRKIAGKGRRRSGRMRPDQIIWEGELHKQQHNLKEQIQRIAGSRGMEKLQEAVDAFDMSDDTPTESESESDVDAVVNTQGPPSAPPPQVHDVHADPELIHRGLPKRSCAGGRAAIPAAPPPLEIQNEQLAHELLLDATFRLDNLDDPTGSLGPHAGLVRQVKAVARRALRDRILEDLSHTPPIYTGALALLEEIRDMIAELTPNRKDLATELKQHVDLDIIRQMLDNRSFKPENLADIVAYLTDRILGLEAPVHNAKTREWILASSARVRNSTDHDAICMLPELMDYLYDKVEGVKLDTANAHLAMLVPYLKEHGAAYESERFMKRLHRGEITGDRTIEWLRACIQKETALVKDILGGNRASYSTLVAASVLSLLLTHLDGSYALTPENVPETLLLDVGRLALFQDDVQHLTLTMSGTTLFNQLSAQNGVRPTHDEGVAVSDGFYALLGKPTVNLGELEEHLVDSLTVCLERAGTTLGDEQKTMAGSLLKKTVSTGDGVYRVLARRVADLLRSQVVTRDLNVAAKLTAKHGMQPIVKHAEALAEKVNRVIAVNVSAHLNYYSGVVNKLCR